MTNKIISNDGVTVGYVQAQTEDLCSEIKKHLNITAMSAANPLHYMLSMNGENDSITQQHLGRVVEVKKWNERGQKTQWPSCELVDGTWLEGMGDGRFYDEDDRQWAELTIEAYDEDCDPVECVYSYGFVRQ